MRQKSYQTSWTIWQLLQMKTTTTQKSVKSLGKKGEREIQFWHNKYQRKRSLIENSRFYFSFLRVSFSNRPTGASTRGAEEESTKGVKSSAEGQSSPFRNKPTTQVSDSPPPYTSGAHYTSSPNNDGNIQGGSQFCSAQKKQQFKTLTCDQSSLAHADVLGLGPLHTTQGWCYYGSKSNVLAWGKAHVRKNDQSPKEILQVATKGKDR